MRNSIRLKKLVGVFLFIGLFAFALPGAFRPALAQFTPYSDFGTGMIDSSLWSSYEMVRATDPATGKLLLSMRSSSGSSSLMTNWLSLLNPGSVTSIGANVTPQQFSNPSGANPLPNPSSGVGAHFYNDGTSKGSGDCTGDVQAQVAIGGRSTSPYLTYSVVKFTAADCTTWNVLKSVSYTETAIAMGTSYPLSVAWDGNTTISFALGSYHDTYAITDTVRAAPAAPQAGLFSKVTGNLLNNTGLEASTAALFDTVYVGGVVYEAFNTPGAGIDKTKWSTYEFKRVIESVSGSNKLDLEARTDTGSTSTVDSSLNFNNPENITAIQAEVTPVRFTYNANSTSEVRIAGRFFNDGSSGGGYIGDILGEVQIVATSGGQKGAWRVLKHTSATDPSVTQVLASGKFTRTIKLNTPYQLSVGWDGTDFVFNIGKEAYAWTKPVTMTANSCNMPSKFLSSRASLPSSTGEPALAQAYFGAVEVQYAIPMTNGIPITTTAAAFSLSAAFDGHDYLLGLRDMSTGEISGTVSAQFIDGRTGAISGSAIATGRIGEGVPQVAFDGTNYLLVWRDATTGTAEQIYGMLIGKSGAAVGTPFPIGPTPSAGQKLALKNVVFDKTNYFVVWKDGGGVYGQQVSTEGVLAKGPVTIIDTTGQALTTAVAFDGTNYLAAWNTGADIYGQFVSKASSLVGSRFHIDTTSDVNGEPPLLFFDGQQYVLTVQHTDTATTYDVRFISKKGVVSDGPELYSGNNVLDICSVMHFDGTNYIAVCDMIASPSPLVVFAKGRLYDAAFKPVTNWTNIFSTKNGEVPIGPTVHWNDSQKYLALATRAVYDSVNDRFANGTVIAKFLSPPLKPDLTVDVEGNGLVTSGPAGIKCANGSTGACTATFKPHAVVKLTPKAARGSVFSGWSGACAGASTCTLTMNNRKSVVATFATKSSSP